MSRLMEIPHNGTDMVCRSIEEMASATSQVLNKFLCEYCEVKGIKEEELRNHLEVVHNPLKGILLVKEGDMEVFREVFSGLKAGEDSYSLNYDIYIMDKLAYPKTLSFIKEVRDRFRKGFKS